MPPAACTQPSTVATGRQKVGRAGGDKEPETRDTSAVSPPGVLSAGTFRDKSLLCANQSPPRTRSVSPARRLERCAPVGVWSICESVRNCGLRVTARSSSSLSRWSNRCARSVGRVLWRKRTRPSASAGNGCAERIVSEAPGLAPLVAALQALVELVRAAGGRGVVIGGVAASILGRPRLTRDVDAMLLLPDADWERFIDLARAAGFDPRLPDVLAFARRSRVFLFRHRAAVSTPTSQSVCCRSKRRR